MTTRTMTPADRKAYNAGWTAGQRQSFDALGKADQRGVPAAWYCGFHDAAAGDDKFAGLAGYGLSL